MNKLSVERIHADSELPISAFEGGLVVRMATLPKDEKTALYEIVLVNFNQKSEPQSAAEALRDHTTALIFEHGLMPALIIPLYMGEPTRVVTTLDQAGTDELWKTYNETLRQRIGFMSRLLVDYEERSAKTPESQPSKFTYRKNFNKEIN